MDLVTELSTKIARAGMEELFTRVEMPLVSVLAAMERKGVLLDRALLKSMSLEIEQLLDLSEEKICRLAGERFNINSPKQLQAILFDKLGLPRGRKTKEGYSTDVDVLSTLALSHELPAEILAYRGMVKLKSTYIDALPRAGPPPDGTGPHLLQPDGNGDGEALQQQPQPPEHPDPDARGEADPPGLHRPARVGDRLGRLLPDRTAGPGPPLRG